MANKPPSQLVTLDPDSPEFDDPASAADAVSRDFGKLKDVEQAAVVIKKPNGKYGYSTVAPQTTHDSFALRAGLPKDHSIAGVVHSHPGADALGQVFSPQDLNVADKLGVPSYIRFINDNSIRQYQPGQTKTQNTPTPGDRFGMGTKSAVGDPLPLPAQPATATDPQALATALKSFVPPQTG